MKNSQFHLDVLSLKRGARNKVGGDHREKVGKLSRSGSGSEPQNGAKEPSERKYYETAP